MIVLVSSMKVKTITKSLFTMNTTPFETCGKVSLEGQWVSLFLFLVPCVLIEACSTGQWFVYKGEQGDTTLKCIWQQQQLYLLYCRRSLQSSVKHLTLDDRNRYTQIALCDLEPSTSPSFFNNHENIMNLIEKSAGADCK